MRQEGVVGSTHQVQPHAQRRIDVAGVERAASRCKASIRDSTSGAENHATTESRHANSIHSHGGKRTRQPPASSATTAITASPGQAPRLPVNKIGRAACRERVWKYV